MTSRFTGVQINTSRSTSSSSGYFGACELCGKHVSDIFLAKHNDVHLSDAGVYYLGVSSPETFGHEKCLSERYPNAIDTTSFPRLMGRSVVITKELFEERRRQALSADVV